MSPGRLFQPATAAQASRTAIPNTGVIDQDGRALRFYDDLVKGKVVLLNFFFTSCGETCPLVTENLRAVQDLLGERMGRDIFMLSVSLQPELETPAILKDYAEQWDVRPGLAVPHRPAGRHRPPAPGDGFRQRRPRVRGQSRTATPAWSATATTGSTAGPAPPASAARPGSPRP